MSSDKAYFINSFYVRLLGLDKGLVSPKKPRLVFLHGLLGNGQNWLPVARFLEEKFTILLIDQRGHGKTGRLTDGGYEPQDFSDDLLGILKELNWSRISLVGHSLGARTAFHFAAHHSELLEKVVFEDMGPHQTGEASQQTVEMIQSVPVPFTSREEAKRHFEEVFKARFGKVFSDYLYSNLSKKEDGLYSWRFDQEGVLRCLEIGRERSFWNEFEAVKTPSLIIRGEKSQHLPKKVYQEMLSRNSNASGVEISGAGHWVHFDQFSEFVTQVDKFLSE